MKIAFKKIMAFMMNPLVLVLLVPGCPLLMYLAIHDFSMGCMLNQHDEIGKKGTFYLLSEQEIRR